MNSNKNIHYEQTKDGTAVIFYTDNTYTILSVKNPNREEWCSEWKVEDNELWFKHANCSLWRLWYESGIQYDLPHFHKYIREEMIALWSIENILLKGE